MKKKEILEIAEKENLRLIRFLYCDLAGVIRGKTVSASQLSTKMV
jgi:glutamine synthetase